MVAVVQPSAATAFAGGLLDWDSDVFGVGLLDGSWTYDPDAEFMDVLDFSILAGDTLTGCVRLPDGVCDADDVMSLVLNPGDTARAVIIFQDTGTVGTSRIIYYADENGDATPIERVGDGNVAPIIWSSSPRYIFQL